MPFIILSAQARDVMIADTIEAHVHYMHSPQEVAELDAAIVPMVEYIARCSHPTARASMRSILKGDYFRRRDAINMRTTLLRAVKFARAHLDEYFETMRPEILTNAQVLENATNKYWGTFERLMDESIPTH